MIKDLQPGQYIYTYHESVSGERPQMDITYFRVISLTPKTVILRWEHEEQSFRKKREWVEENFYPVGSEWHPEISNG